MKATVSNAPPPGINAVIRADIDAIIKSLKDVRKLSGMTLLVTGANGFLCSYFVDTIAALNDQGIQPPCQVVAVDDLQVGSLNRLAHLAGRADVQLLQHSVTQPLHLEKVDWIIHGASIASPMFYRRYPLETIDANVSGTRLMLELAQQKHTRSILYLSTSEIYGDPDPAFIPTAEDYRGNVSCTGPRACYDESKRLAETLCATFYRLDQLPVKVIRPFNVYGPGQRLDDGRIIPDLVRSAVNRQPIVLYSDGRATRAFCYISDAIRAMWAVLLSDADGEVFNVGNDQEEISMYALAEKFRKIAGAPWLEIVKKISADANFVADNPQRRCPNLNKLRSQFNWEPEISLAEGLERTLHSYSDEIS
jgi:dTDP-glucose 4,6-dehydratase/UDP-glucuronate decarboxylase